MGLFEDLHGWYDGGNAYPPEGEELDQHYDSEYGTWVSHNTTTEQVDWNVVDTSGRWGNQIEVVYKRGDELVAVYDMEPATEMQSWGDYGKPEIVPVEAYEVTTVKYRKAKAH